jgi:hypothetical protein
MSSHVHDLEPEYHEKRSNCSELASAMRSYAQRAKILFFTWEADVLPLNYARALSRIAKRGGVGQGPL